jgi:hypothetical protein
MPLANARTVAVSQCAIASDRSQRGYPRPLRRPHSLPALAAQIERAFDKGSIMRMGARTVDRHFLLVAECTGCVTTPSPSDVRGTGHLSVFGAGALD